MRSVLLCTAIAGLIIPMSASALTLKVANNHQKTNPTNIALNEMNECLVDSTGGDLKLQIFTDGLLGNEQETVDQLRAGIIDMVRASPITLEAYDVAYSFLNLPFLFENSEEMNRVMEAIKSDVYELGRDKGFRGVAWNDSNPRSFYNTKRPIYKPSDLNGLKIRVPNSRSFVQTMELLGATPTPLPYSEQYTALQGGIIDGGEGDVGAVVESKFGEVAKYYSYDRHYMVPDMLIISNKAYGKLNINQKEALENCSLTYTSMIRGLNEERERKLTLEAKDNLNVHFNEVNDIEEFKSLVKPMYVEAEKNPEVKVFLDKVEEAKRI